MQTNGNGSGTFATMRLDLATKISLMAAIIYGTSFDECSVKDAVERATQIIELSDQQAAELKKVAR